jgi:hypothetical protein
MPKNTTPLALVALIVIVAASMAALAGSDIMRPSSEERVLPPKPAESASQPPEDTAAVDPVVDIARRFALAARNWTPATYRTSWEKQIQLAGGGYRRALIAKRPGRRELAALRADQARSRARVVKTERDRGVRPPSARVLVTLDEETSAADQAIRGPTLNEARLSRRGGRWSVVGWTVIPGG